MRLKKFLTDHKKEITERWFEIIIQTYPAESFKFFSESTKKFSNPVGYTIHEEISSIYEDMVNLSCTEHTEKSLENIIKIRAVQEFTPTEAVSFIFRVKGIVRESAAELIPNSISIKEINNLDDFCDELACKAFDLYMSAREKLYEIKANEVRKRTQKIIDRLNRKYDNMSD